MAIALAVQGTYAGAGIALIGSFICDGIDGPVAKRMSGRTSEQGAFGANLDSLADIVAAGVALGAVVMSYGHFQAGYVVLAVLLSAAAALRLSYFNVHGLNSADTGSDTYVGLPTDLAVLAFVALMLLDWPLGDTAFRAVLSAGAVVLAALMVSPLPIPKLAGRRYVAVMILSLVIAAAHAAILIT